MTQGWGGGAPGLKVLDAHDLSDIHVAAEFASASGQAVSLANGLVYLLVEDGLYVLQSNLLTDVRRSETSPTKYFLCQNYPNPFNPSTTIKYGLARSSMVRLSVYDTLGREVQVLVNERKNAGSYDVKFDAAGVSSGVYLYRLQAGDFVQSRKLLLLRFARE